MKPWEENWEATKANDIHGPEGRIIANFYEHGIKHSGEPAAYAKDEARAKLAAQAPKMARYLKSIRWQLRSGEVDEILRDAGVIE